MLTSSLKHQIKLVLQPDYRIDHQINQELERIKEIQRYITCSTSFLGKPLKIIDGLSFYHSYKEIFQRKIYSFSSSSKPPYIIDCGSNIGLSIIFIKRLYPEAKVLGFEADPKVFQVLRENVEAFGYTNVELINKAVWNSETFLEFSSEGADGGRVSRTSDKQEFHIIKVPTIRLNDYLNQPVDFLKLDIEGAETDVIVDCIDNLVNVQNLFVEYHSFINEEQRIDQLLSALKKAGFRIHIHSQFSSPCPLIENPIQLGMDLQLNIFGHRN